MAGLEAHFLPETTISDDGGVTFVMGSPFLGILAPSSCDKCHCINLIWSRPRWTSFFVAVINPIRDISCLTGLVGL